MEPRELWERHTVLAQAFCQSDEDVRTAQSTLDDAQAGRARSLAAFAVMVGNDKAVAEMLGLPEREVRVARRTVGREDARSLADDLLTPLMQPQPPQQGEEQGGQGQGGGEPGGQSQSQGQSQSGWAQAPAQSADPARGTDPAQAQTYDQAAQQNPGQGQGQGQGQAQGQARSQGQGGPHFPPNTGQPTAAPYNPYQQSAAAPSGPQESFGMHDPRQLPDHMGWSPVQDAVLVDGWQSGVDLENLAFELGTDLRRLTARAQYLSTQGRLLAVPEEIGRQGGRHRRESAQQHQYASGQQQVTPSDLLLPDGLLPDGYGGYWANWNEMLPAPQP